MRRIALLLTLSLLAWTFGPRALQAQQTGTVQGRVVTESGESLAGAQVSVQGTGLGGLTNTSGRYLILNVPSGQHTIQVQSMGYGTVSANVSVTAGQVTTQDFRVGQEAVALQELTVSVGSRAAHTAADELPVPVDVMPSTKLEQANQPDFLGTIMEVEPSIWVPQNQISDLSSAARPFEMRGMSPDQSLVLIDGVRREKVANVSVFGGERGGSSGVDMNAIPQMALSQMEVLRDGASAQYGSDAMAGVINLRLKDQVSPLTVQLGGGKYYPRWFPPDGLKGRISANWGFEFLGGVLNLTGEYAQRHLTSRAGPSKRDQMVAGDGDVLGKCSNGAPFLCVVQKNNPVPQPTFFIADGPYENRMVWANYKRKLGEDQNQTMQIAATYSDRNDQTTCYRRRGLESRNWKSIYPEGFMPVFDQDTQDIQVIAGLTGQTNNWNYSIKGTYGQNVMDLTMANTLNVSLGPSVTDALAPGRDGILGTADDPGIPNATKFYAGSLKNDMYLLDAHASRPYDVGLSSPLTFTVGALFMANNYQIHAGVPGSYINGFYPAPGGGLAAGGAQCFVGWRAGQQGAATNPGDEVNTTRTSEGVFAEGEVNLTSQLLADGAVRYEHYSDFGSTVNGKLALRFQPADPIIIRGSVSTGFRAPTVGEKVFTHVSTGFNTTASGDQVAVESGLFPPGSPAAKALGATPLKQETSVNYAGGIALTPVNNLNITADAYLINVNNAIILGNNLSGDLVQQTLDAHGIQATEARYLTNALDLQHKGVTFTGDYRWLLAEEMYLEFNGNVTFEKTKVRGQVKTPPILVQLGQTLFSRSSIDNIENNRPASKGNGSITYRFGPFRAVGTMNYYGATNELISTNPDVRHTWHRVETYDIEGSWRFNNGVRVTLGAENVTDVMPEVTPNLTEQLAQGGPSNVSSFTNIFWPGAAFPWVNGRYLFFKTTLQIH